MKDEGTKNWKKIKEESERVTGEMLDENADEGDFAVRADALEHPGYKALQEQLTLAEQKAQENWEKSVRAQAELDNFRRRAERDVAHAHRFGLEKFINSLLPVVDSLEQALQLADKEAQEGMHQGLELTMKLMMTVLEKQGVVPIDALGLNFNPEEHEAMSLQVDENAKPNSVIAVFQKGYKLADRVIRPARVIVAKSGHQDT